MTCYDAAVNYAAQGFHVIPTNGKVPLVPWKSYQAEPADRTMIDLWWQTYPDANVALVLGRGMFAVDVDGPEGHRALAAEGISIPPMTPTSLTGKGVHYLFRGHQPDRVGLLPKVDIRGQGIIVAPPSIHPVTHRQYLWLVPPDALPDPPEALVRLLTNPPDTHGPVTSGWLAESLAGVGEGQRNATCVRLAGYFLGKGVPEEAVIQMLIGWADKCSPRFPVDEVIDCVRSIAKREGVHTDEPTRLADGILTVGALYDAAPDTHEWIVADYIPRGALVMLASEEKTGKSTLVYAMVAAIAKGRPFLGRNVLTVPTLMLAVEEHMTDVKIRSRKFGLTSNDPVRYYIRDLPHDDGTMRELEEIVKSEGIGLVVLDTMGHHLASLIESENESMATLKALKPWLHLARAANAAVVLIHHTGKGFGSWYRGSSSFGGIVDQVMVLRHAGGNQRDLEAKGRYWSTPRSVRIVLDGNEYRVLS